MEKRLIKITKIGKPENPKHPDSDFGESAEFHLGWFTKEPIIEESFRLLPVNIYNGLEGIVTTRVTKIVDENTFHTLNSIYHWEEVSQDGFKDSIIFNF